MALSTSEWKRRGVAGERRFIHGAEGSQEVERAKNRCRSNVARIRQSRPGFGLGFNSFKLFPLRWEAEGDTLRFRVEAERCCWRATFHVSSSPQANLSHKMYSLPEDPFGERHFIYGAEGSQEIERAKDRCRSNVARIRQSGPDFGLGFNPFIVFTLRWEAEGDTLRFRVEAERCCWRATFHASRSPQANLSHTMYLLPEDPSGERHFIQGAEGSHAHGGPLFIYGARQREGDREKGSFGGSIIRADPIQGYLADTKPPPHRTLQ